MKTLKFSLILVTLLLLQSCIKDVICEHGVGEITEETRILNEFNRIKNNISGNVYISQGQKQSLVIKAQQNIINEIETNVSNEELEIEFDRCIGPNDGIDIYITIPEIQKVTLSGSGNIYLDGRINLSVLYLDVEGSGSINANDLYLSEYLNTRIIGSGDIHISGTGVPQMRSLILGSGNINAFEFKSSDNTAIIEGSGSCYLYVTNRLEIDILGSGSVYYIGNPQIKSEVIGSGGIYNMN